jgi:menaquinol-cytochrome c reductase cytochrome b/c subunit
MDQPTVTVAPPVGAKLPEIPLEVRKTYRLLALVKGQTIVKVKDSVDDEVLVWPNLVVLEFIAAAVFTINLMLMSFFVNSPLEDLANPDHTPNPSKAPWYFLNLQELLLHMDPALAGVLVPGLALLALMAIPYIDRHTEEIGRWFSGARGLAISVYAAIYTTICLLLLILFDKFVGVKPLLVKSFLPYDVALVLSGWVIPILVMLALPALLAFLVKRRWQATTHEIMIALFSGFVVTYFVLTIIGTAFRGPGMDLYWPWQMPPKME